MFENTSHAHRAKENDFKKYRTGENEDKVKVVQYFICRNEEDSHEKVMLPFLFSGEISPVTITNVM